MGNTFDNGNIISNLKASVESLIAEIQEISITFINFTDADKVKAFEKTIHEEMT